MLIRYFVNSKFIAKTHYKDCELIFWAGLKRWLVDTLEPLSP